MVHLARNMKENAKAAGRIVREDNKVHEKPVRKGDRCYSLSNFLICSLMKIIHKENSMCPGVTVAFNQRVNKDHTAQMEMMKLMTFF